MTGCQWESDRLSGRKGLYCVTRIVRTVKWNNLLFCRNQLVKKLFKWYFSLMVIFGFLEKSFFGLLNTVNGTSSLWFDPFWCFLKCIFLFFPTVMGKLTFRLGWLRTGSWLGSVKLLLNFWEVTKTFWLVQSVEKDHTATDFCVPFKNNQVLEEIWAKWKIIFLLVYSLACWRQSFGKITDWRYIWIPGIMRSFISELFFGCS